MRPVTINPNDPASALAEIQRASHENDIVDMAQNFGVDDPAHTQSFEVNTTSPTAANCAQVLATLLGVLQKGGMNRTT